MNEKDETDGMSCTIDDETEEAIAMRTGKLIDLQLRELAMAQRSGVPILTELEAFKVDAAEMSEALREGAGPPGAFPRLLTSDLRPIAMLNRIRELEKRADKMELAGGLAELSLLTRITRIADLERTRDVDAARISVLEADILELRTGR
jgi:hypothetical protein